MEEFEITVDKANEVEVAIFDKQGNEAHPVPIGLLWIKISDLVEAQRRQKVQMETGGGGWVTAGAMDGDGGMSTPGGGMGMGGQYGGDMNAAIPFGNNQMAQGAAAGVSDGIDAWFAVEPAGAIALHLNFSKSRIPRAGLVNTEHGLYSQRERAQATPGRSWWSRPSRRCPQAQGRSPRDEWSQVRPATVLPDHPLRVLQRILA